MRFQCDISLYKKNKSIAKNHFHRLFHSYFSDISASMQNSTFLQKKYIIDFSAKGQNRQDSFELFPSSWSIFIYQKNQYRICCFSGIQKNLPSLHFCKRRKIILPRYHSSLWTVSYTHRIRNLPLASVCWKSLYPFHITVDSVCAY